MLIDSGVPRSATAPAQLALDRAIAAETGGSRDDVHQLWYVALTRARYAALIVVSDPDGRASPVTRAIIESADARLTAASNPLEAWLEPVRETVPCPCCSPGGAGTGRLRLQPPPRHRHAGGGPPRALRVLRPVVPVEAAGLPLPPPETSWPRRPGCRGRRSARVCRKRRWTCRGRAPAETQAPAELSGAVPRPGRASRRARGRRAAVRAALHRPHPTPNAVGKGTRRAVGATNTSATVTATCCPATSAGTSRRSSTRC